MRKEDCRAFVVEGEGGEQALEEGGEDGMLGGEGGEGGDQGTEFCEV